MGNSQSSGLQQRLAKDLSRFGLKLSQLFITSITPPPEVQQSIDDKSRLGVIQDMDKLIKLKAASAMEKAAESTGEAAAGLGMGMGFMMPAMFAQSQAQAQNQPPQPANGPAARNLCCPDCGLAISADANFCHHCGTENIPESTFCDQCGDKLDTP